ncbi:1-acyl-sn-glycerol-3-phosphate acyltransferase [Xanthovirga aplysinae]|uniref:1-acyl-sn-glycerol-3-phosphate acyltransferase n=1 Tax=Xanthovirga aplysinae TaxID=2529853 RepID=UPI0012BCAF8F|nr:1-acyl-sn-glycerol-3-phosphate acyltransferase [Xanthovirga aplysinae]MTI31196.1 glycerol acyltransferase [Xanthovirga aplysinae]
MFTPSDFDEIRPFRDEEVDDVLGQLSKDEDSLKYLQLIFPKLSKEEILDKLKNLHTIKDFQVGITYPALQRLLKETTDGLSHSGFDQVDENQSYLYISNHRDIVLDSALLNYILHISGHETTEVGIGSNLLMTPFTTWLAKLNRNFVVNRNVPPRQMYNYSQLLSAYIRHTLTEKQTSVWIAQGEGRAKDGNDQTQAGLLKMFTLSSGEEDFIESKRMLNIRPFAISYELNPCDIMMAQEIYIRKTTGSYEKKAGEDLQSMITGISGYKGRVHLSLAKPLDKELEALKTCKNKNEQIRELAKMIDQKIYENYKLWPSNWIAYDVLHETNHITKYSQEERSRFMQYLGGRIMMMEGDKTELRKILLQMYSYPVSNYLASK